MAISFILLCSARNDCDFFISGPLGSRGKCTAPGPLEDIFDLKPAKIVTNEPSDTEKSAVHQRIQEEPSENILDDCPEPDPDILPIALVYEGYGHFLDIMKARDDVPGLADVDVEELEDAVDDLASKMTGFFSNDDDRRNEALPILNRVFSARRRIEIPQLYAAAIGSVQTGGHNIANGVATMIAEFKNWSADISSLPEMEVLCYPARPNARQMNDEAFRQLFLRWRVPCVGLTIVGELHVPAFHIYSTCRYSS